MDTALCKDGVKSKIWIYVICSSVGMVTYKNVYASMSKWVGQKASNDVSNHHRYEFTDEVKLNYTQDFFI